MADQPKHISPSRIFLYDSLGALTTFLFLFLMSVKYQEFIGMPFTALYLLCAVAALFFLYSLICHLFATQNRQTLLKIITTSNMLYAVVTLSLVFYYFAELTILGRSYFLAEAVVIGFLCHEELKTITYGDF